MDTQGQPVRDVFLSLRSGLSRAWTEIEPDERRVLFGSVAASVGIPILVALVLDPLAEVLRLSLWWCLFLGLPAGSSRARSTSGRRAKIPFPERSSGISVPRSTELSSSGMHLSGKFPWRRFS